MTIRELRNGLLETLKGKKISVFGSLEVAKELDEKFKDYEFVFEHHFYLKDNQILLVVKKNTFEIIHFTVSGRKAPKDNYNMFIREVWTFEDLDKTLEELTNKVITYEIEKNVCSLVDLVKETFVDQTPETIREVLKRLTKEYETINK